VDLLETWKVEGLVGLQDSSRSLAVAKIRAFLREALRREWITNPLADKVRPHSAPREAGEPFTELEVTRLLEGCANMGANGSHGYAGHPATFRLLLELMLATGMRVGDAILYDPAKVTKGERIWVYHFQPQKVRRVRPKDVEVFIPVWLKVAIDRCQWLSEALPFCWGNFDRDDYLAGEVRYRMGTIGRRQGISDCRPHRLRDTFAVWCLLRGMTLDDLSRLLGHSSPAVTQMHYAKWTPGRASRLERLVADTLHAPSAAETAVDPRSDTGGDGQGSVPSDSSTGSR
jgi:integrase